MHLRKILPALEHLQVQYRFYEQCNRYTRQQWLAHYGLDHRVFIQATLSNCRAHRPVGKHSAPLSPLPQSQWPSWVLSSACGPPFCSNPGTNCTMTSQGPLLLIYLSLLKHTLGTNQWLPKLHNPCPGASGRRLKVPFPAILHPMLLASAKLSKEGTYLHDSESS